jgi:osmoprotectant transport system permease protein
MIGRVCLLLVTVVSLGPVRGSEPVTEVGITVGSKAFTESVILGEMVFHLAEIAGAKAEYKRELGGTRVLWNALLRGDIDVYPEYTGTIAQEILKGTEGGEIALALAERGIVMSRPLGFNNTYALGMLEDVAARRDIRTISDLRRLSDLRLGFSNEFMDRGDGWPSLRDRYGLTQKDVNGLNHDLAYRGLAAGTIDVTDLYSTDAEIRYYSLRVLQDDQRHFPAYHAVLLYRQALLDRAPQVVESMLRLEGAISDARMVELNAKAKLDKIPENLVAAEFLTASIAEPVNAVVISASQRLLTRTREHLILVALSLLAAIVISVPLGILAAKKPRIGQAILGVVGIVQTIPALALLVLMIPLLGIGSPPALAALFLYSLLPIVRNTATGLTDIPQHVRESAQALGLPAGTRLRLVELPLASRSILAGIKTSAVINVGFATLGALIGAGGLGQLILTGIRLDDVGLILQGAVPAALLALLVQGLFELGERFLVPRGLRLPVQ